MSYFNYIITCHNSDALIERVLDGVRQSIDLIQSFDGCVIVVLDGCTDATAEIVSRYDWVRSIETANVHELLSINAGLRAAPQEGDGYNIILQDDVILEEPRLEELIEKLYGTIRFLGYVSFRFGCNLAPDEPVNPYLIQCDQIESLYGHGGTEATLMPYHFVPRAVPVKSPVCLPCKLVREVGLFDENMAPYGYDDADYAIRARQAGYLQGVFAIPFQSDVRWGGTRKPGHPDVQPIVRRNAVYLRQKHAEPIASGLAEDSFQAVIGDPIREQMREAQTRWERAQALLKEMNP